jgi:hypothetical protein
VEFLYRTSIGILRQLRTAIKPKNFCPSSAAATIISNMEPQSIGRALGIGLRVAGRIAGQRFSASGQASEACASNSAPVILDGAQTGKKADAYASGRAAGQVSRGVARGLGGFLRPFQRVGGIIWLEVTGAFFLLPVVAFAPTLWRVRASWLHGPDHRLFLVTAGIMTVFFYLSVTSFWRARRR